MLSLAAINVLTDETVGKLRLLDYFSTTERSQYAKVRNQELRRRWISGRLAAKHLLLTEMGNVRTNRSRDLTWIEIAEIEEFPTWLYRKIEILRSQPENRFPCVTWAGRAHPGHISLSYTHQFAVACFDPVAMVGVDLDIPSRRNAAFYRINFSLRERSWAERLSRSAPVDADWPYSILWCLKESVLKAKAAPGITLWQLPRIEVQPQFELNRLIASVRSRSKQPRLISGEIEVWDDKESRIGEVTLALMDQAVLTALRLQA